MEEFRRHARWCALGQPADGRQRLDLFPDYGARLPVWHRGDGRFTLHLSADLQERLISWSRGWEHRIAPGEEASTRSDWRERWTVAGIALGHDLEEETGCVVVVLEPDDPHRANDCPECGRPWQASSGPT